MFLLLTLNQIYHHFLLFLFLTLNRQMLAGFFLFSFIYPFLESIIHFQQHFDYLNLLVYTKKKLFSEKMFLQKF